MATQGSPTTVSVFRFEYEISPNMNQWNVFIAAFTHEEAYNHLQKTINKPIRITSSTMVCRLDDVSDGIRQNVIQAFLGKQGKNKPIAEDKIVSVETPEAKEEAAERKKFGKK